MPDQTLARRYATAFFELASDANAVGTVRTDLHAFVDTLHRDEQVQRFFRSPVVDREQKAAIVGSTFKQLHEIALNGILLLIHKRRESLIEEIVRQYDDIEREARGAKTLTITTARALSQAELDEIVGKVGAAYKTSFDVTQSVDPHLIGGIRLMIGDRRIDGTIAGRLDDLARMLSTN